MRSIIAITIQCIGRYGNVKSATLNRRKFTVASRPYVCNQHVSSKSNANNNAWNCAQFRGHNGHCVCFVVGLHRNKDYFINVRTTHCKPEQWCHPHTHSLRLEHQTIRNSNNSIAYKIYKIPSVRQLVSTLAHSVSIFILFIDRVCSRVCAAARDGVFYGPPVLDIWIFQRWLLQFNGPKEKKTLAIYGTYNLFALLPRPPHTNPSRSTWHFNRVYRVSLRPSQCIVCNYDCSRVLSSVCDVDGVHRVTSWPLPREHVTIFVLTYWV